MSSFNSNNEKSNHQAKSNHHDENNHHDEYSHPDNAGSAKASTLEIYLSWGGVILWMALIFSLSHQPTTDSNQLSRDVLAMVLQELYHFIAM